MMIRVWLPSTFEGSDPEQAVSERHKNRLVSMPEK